MERHVISQSHNSYPPFSLIEITNAVVSFKAVNPNPNPNLPSTMNTLTDLPAQSLLLRPRPPSTSPSSLFYTLPLARRNLTARIRCSIAEDSSATTISPPHAAAKHSSSSNVDCVVVGGGISGLCIAQALATKHSDVVPNVIVTEARDRVGGNIITVERDGYLWEEGPNSFQPSDSMLTMIVCDKLSVLPKVSKLLLGNYEFNCLAYQFISNLLAF